jgi:glycerophosphoryl diester phosphodiesterase
VWLVMSLLLHPGRPLVIGHRGAAAVRPENTLPAFAHAIALGVDAIEFDVRVTGDGVAVVHHDPTTGRTCGEDLVIERASIGALRRLDPSATFTGAYRPPRRSPIPLLDEVLDMTRATPVIIECKTVDAAPLVIDALAAHGATDRAVVGSFLHGAMRIVRAQSVPSGASRRDIISLLLRGVVRLAPRRLPFAAMCIPEAANGITLPIARFAAWGRAIGVPVHVWTVNTAADAHRLWDAGVTGVISDDPEAILAARAARATR